MQIERTDTEIVIRLPKDTDVSGLQRILDFLQYKKIVAKSQISNNQINTIAAESKATYWKNNKDKFLK